MIFSFFIDTAHLRGDLHLPFPHLDAGTPPHPLYDKTARLSGLIGFGAGVKAMVDGPVQGTQRRGVEGLVWGGD